MVAEGVGFEPTFPFGKAVFKTATINHSDTPPGFETKVIIKGIKTIFYWSAVFL